MVRVRVRIRVRDWARVRVMTKIKFRVTSRVMARVIPILIKHPPKIKTHGRLSTLAPGMYCKTHNVW